MNILQDLSDFLSRDSSQLTNLTLQCPTCGKPHAIPFSFMQVGRGLSESLPAILRQLSHRPFTRVCVVYDRVIEDLIQERVTGPLAAAGLQVATLPLGAPGLMLNMPMPAPGK